MVVLLLAGCGGAVTVSSEDTGDDGPTAIGFNKAASAPNISALTENASELVASGTSVCASLKAAFVEAMVSLDGIYVERDVSIYSYDAEINGDRLKIDLSPWGGHECSGNTAEFPVCYTISVNDTVKVRGVIISAADDMSGEVGEMEIPFGEGGEYLLVEYDTASAVEPGILLRVLLDADADGVEPPEATQCRIVREKMANGRNGILMEMYKAGADGEMMFVARSDGISTSVMIDGGELDTEGTPVCLSIDGREMPVVKDAIGTTAASGGSSCEDVDVGDHVFSIAP